MPSVPKYLPILFLRVRSQSAAATAASIASASRVGPTSWTRRMCAPWAAAWQARAMLPGRRSVDRPVQHGADQRLARHAHQQRQTGGLGSAAGASAGSDYAPVSCRNRSPDRSRAAPAGIPASSQAATRDRQELVDIFDDVVVRGERPAWSAAHPACASGRPARRARRRSRARPGARRALTSLIIRAPAATAATHDLRLAGIDRDRRAPARRGPR